MSREVNSAFTGALVDGWVRAGVTDVVISPGSRSAPLAYAVAAEGRLARHIVLDERAAAFVAVGLGRITGRPAVVITTSGTAAANLHPAVLEAHHGFVPMIVATADRPPELRDTGAPQTIDQRRLFGAAVRWFADPPAPVDDAGRVGEWRALGARSVAEATGAVPGPVHLNLAFAEPLVPAADSLVGPEPSEAPVDPNARAADPDAAAHLTPAALSALVDEIVAAPHGVVIAGAGHGVAPETIQRFATASGWPLIPDLLSGLGALPAAIARSEGLVRDPDFAAAHAPTLALRVGAPLTSATVIRWLERVGTDTRLIDPHGRWRVPVYGASSVIAAEAEWLLTELAARLDERRAPASGWAESWTAAEERAAAALDATVDSWRECSEPRAARDVVRAVPADAALVVASSMPVRDVEWFAAPRDDIRVLANRGVNGIDGFIATATGVALAASSPVVALCGDLCFLHDGGGRLAAAALAPNLVVVVIDNGGGGIFSFLPQAAGPAGFEELFGTPPEVDLAAIARAHGFTTTTVEAPDALAGVVAEAVAVGSPAVVIVRTDRARNVDHHAQAWAAVGRAVRGST